MLHDFPLINTLASGLGLALLLGFFAMRLKLPALVGYLLAGILIGPFTPGFVADSSIANELAEIGIMLLMFGVGLHFSIDDLLQVKRIALPGAILQILVATVLGGGLAWWWGWSIPAALMFGLSLSVASTVVLLRALEANGMLETINGRIAVGWLIVEDLIMVLVLVLLPAFSGAIEGAAGQIAHGNFWYSLVITLLEVALFIVLMLVVGKRIFPALLWQVARTGSRELFTLCVVAAAVGIAYGASALFGVSYALGAFFSGMVLRESEFSHRAAEESLPLREAFAVLFFVSVGMLFKPAILLESPLKVVMVAGIIILGKSVAAAALVHAFKYPLKTALTVSASLAQIGEFSFILAGLGVSLGILPEQGQSLIVAGALISIALNPLVFSCVNRLERWIKTKPRLDAYFSNRYDPLAQLDGGNTDASLAKPVVLVGYGRVGGRIGEQLKVSGIPFVVVEQNRELVKRMRDSQIEAVSGNGLEANVLIQAHITNARMLVIAIPDSFSLRNMISLAKSLNPSIKVLVRCHDEEEKRLLKCEVDCDVFLGEAELAKSMAEKITHEFKSI